MGLRYIEAQYNPKTYQVQLGSLPENKEYLEQVHRSFCIKFRTFLILIFQVRLGI